MFLMTIASLLELLGLGLVIVIINSFLGLDDIYPTVVQNFLNFLSIDNNEISIHLILIFVTILFTIKLFILIFTSYKKISFWLSLEKIYQVKCIKFF